MVNYRMRMMASLSGVGQTVWDGWAHFRSRSLPSQTAMMQKNQKLGLLSAWSYAFTPAMISALASSGPNQPSILTHLPSSRSL